MTVEVAPHPVVVEHPVEVIEVHPAAVPPLHPVTPIIMVSHNGLPSHVTAQNADPITGGLTILAIALMILLFGWGLVRR